MGRHTRGEKKLACQFTRVSESAKHEKQTQKELKQRPEALRGPFDRGGEKVDKGGEKVAPEETKEKRKQAPAGVRKKWFPSMILASLEAILSTLDGGIAVGILVHLY